MQENQTKVAVLGLGNWGTALGHHLAKKGFDVLGWSIEEPVVTSINTEHQNARYLKGVPLHPELRATLSLEQALEREILLLVVPSAIMGKVVPKMKIKENSVIISAIKGLHGETLLTPLQYLEQHGPKCRGLSVLSGPSFAIDIASGSPCGIVAASNNAEIARFTADLFFSDTMRVYVSHDPLGVEIGAAIKNVIALAAGVCDGMGLGDSARAGLITRGLAEMMRLAKAMGADIQTLAGLSGLGDLIMTATCDTSRNRTVGLRLGKGEKLVDILQSLGSVAEGVETTPHALKLAQKYNVEMPIAFQASRLISGEATPQEITRALLNRPMKKEF